MELKRSRRSSLLAFLVFTALLINSVPARAQDIVSTSEDVTSGSSVFVFRQSRKAPQARSSYKSKTSAQRNSGQRNESRIKIREQVASTQKAKPRQRITTAPTPTANGPKVTSPEQASKVFASAGETYLDQKNYDKAIEYFKKSAELDPKNSAAKLALSESYVHKGDETLEAGKAPTSLFYYEEGIKANPNNPGAHAGMGEAYDAMGNSDKALAAYEKAIALEPNLTELYAPLGILYFQKGEIAKAENYLTKIRAVRPDDPETEFFYGLILAKQNRNDEAITAFQRSIAKSPTAEAHLNLGEAYDRADRDKEAIAEYQEAIKLNPRYVEAYYDLGVAFYNREKYTDAVAAYLEAIKIKNDYADAHANLAETYRQLGSDEKDAARRKDWLNKAVGAYSIATAFIQNDAELYNSYGFTLGKLGRWTQAIDALKKAITAKSDAVDYSNLGWAYYNASVEESRLKQDAAAREKLLEAKTALEKAVSLNNKFEAAYLNLGIAQNDLGEFQAAVGTLQTALSLRKDWSVAHNELGISYRKLYKFDEAVEQFKRATDLDENYAVAFYNLGESEYRRGKTKEAKKAQEKLRKLHPNLARQLDVVFSGAIIDEGMRKVQQNNPLNKLPKPRFP